MIYFAQARHGGPVKIGVSSSIDRRRKSLSTGVIGGMEIIAEMEGDGPLESFLHEAFNPIRVENEFFRSGPAIWEFLLGLIKDGRPDWLPTDINRDLTEMDLVEVFGSIHAAIVGLRYSGRVTLYQALNSMSGKRARFPGMFAFHKAVKEGRVPDFVTALHKPSAERKAA